ncbi:hypothetical protein [Streptomyces sp. NPDC052107]|uniref:hypothetical protein n=1 Tax=Streptomyces sp. NPDC052107 TaxID=3155632 RepID=UPI00341AD6AA
MRHHVGRRIAEAARLGTALEGLTVADLVQGVKAEPVLSCGMTFAPRGLRPDNTVREMRRPEAIIRGHPALSAEVMTAISIPYHRHEISGRHHALMTDVTSVTRRRTAGRSGIAHPDKAMTEAKD